MHECVYQKYLRPSETQYKITQSCDKGPSNKSKAISSAENAERDNLESEAAKGHPAHSSA